MRREARFAAAGCAVLLLGGCGMGRAALDAQPVQSAAMAPVTTAEGIQQFSVPADGRALLGAELRKRVPGPIQDAQISNAWRTAASAQKTPDDYAACVTATTPQGNQTFVMVKSGGGRSAGIGDVIAGAAAAKRCGDPSRVVQWAPLTEAVAMQ
ncbi:hypothetical protein [Labrys wisconsinensis]|uniref:Lipoprotein n=1 Tax=Labrys wisconsinensis TaxID=425677 RepID=A0ABU0JMX6_9HYPH|nr:hypothetical protein [Labrys wisconsinensis]MDQ0474871.1 hypothetical protein [Labrys wisconsinensis]